MKSMIYRIVKRLIDFILATLVIVLTFPLQILIAIILLLLLRENPFFVQLRGCTLEQRRFNIIKFRTIKTSQAKKIEHKNWEDIFLINPNSVLVGGFAGWLRLTGLDELPQIYNVFLGEMSLVGPRPLMMGDLEIMKSKFPIEYKIRNGLRAKPGITGLWQLIGNRNKGVDDLIALDLFYEENQSALFDMRIIVMTIPFVLFAKNSDAIIPRVEFVSKLFSYSLLKLQIRKHTSPASKHYKSYSLKLPSTWWYTSDSYNNQKKQNVKIFPIEQETDKKRANS